MIDIEKVVKGLRCIKGDCYIPCATCKYANADGYGRGDRCKRQCASDAIAMLSEQDNMISIKAVSDFLAEYALPPTLQKQNLFSFNGNMASEWEQFLRDLKGR